MKLSKILLDYDIIIIFYWFLTVFIMIHTFLTITFNHSPTKQANRLIGNLTFTSSLFGGLQKLDGILSAASLILERIGEVRRAASISDSHWDQQVWYVNVTKPFFIFPFPLFSNKTWSGKPLFSRYLPCMGGVAERCTVANKPKRGNNSVFFLIVVPRTIPIESNESAKLYANSVPTSNASRESEKIPAFTYF